jgi:hypothetical protein
MSGSSPIDSLRRLSPVSDASAAAVFGVAGREELLAGVTGLPLCRHAERPRATRRRRPLVLALAVVVLLGTAAAAWALFRSSAQETTSVQCLIKGSDAIIPSTSGNPAHDCAVDWNREFGTAAPPLAAYDNGLGGVTVIPRSEKPQAGWKPLLSQDVALIQLQDSLDDYIGGLNSSCLDGNAATALARARLARFGFTGWTVSLRDGSATGTCVTADIVDPGTQTVMLIPTGPPLAPATTQQKLAARLRRLTQACESLPAAVAAVRSAASSVGLFSADYQLNAVTDNSMRCASIYETVGGTTFITVRGPRD